MRKKQYEKVLSLIESRIAITKQTISDIETGKVDGCLECRKADLEEFEAYKEAIVKKPKKRNGVYVRIADLTHEQRDFICSHEDKCYGCKMAKLGGCIMYDESKKNRSIKLPEGCPGPRNMRRNKNNPRRNKNNLKKGLLHRLLRDCYARITR